MPTIVTGTGVLGTSGGGSPRIIAFSTPGPGTSRTSSSPTSRPVRRWNAGEMATSSVAVAAGSRPASTISSSIGAPLGSDARGKSAFVPGCPATSNPLTANSCMRPDVRQLRAPAPSRSRAGWAAPSRSSVGCALRAAAPPSRCAGRRRTPTARRRHRSPAARRGRARRATVAGRRGRPTPTTPSCWCTPSGATSSSTIRPSRIATVRWAAAAMARSWVTMTIVWPASLSRRKSCSTSAPPSVSRAPVGSSASSTAGELAIARAIANRCRWPPERRGGRASTLSASPSRSSSSRARRPAARRVAPPSIAATATFSAAVIDSSRLKNWNTTPTAWRRTIARSSGPSALTTWPATSTTPSSGTSRPAMIDSSVDFPHPDGPVMATNSPARHVEVGAAQGAHRRRVDVERAVHVAHVHDRGPALLRAGSFARSKTRSAHTAHWITREAMPGGW